MIRNQWYAILSSHEVKRGKVLAVRRFGQDLVAYRTSDGSIAILACTCAHRGASLAKGWVEGDHIRCPFHGIAYDPSGACVYIPSDGRATLDNLSRFHQQAFPVREIGGIVFAWYGEGAPDHEPQVFDVVTDPSYVYSHVSDEWGVHYSRVIENQLDVSHLAFVHRTTIGRGNKTLCNGPKVVWLDDRTLQTSANNEVDTGQTPGDAESSVIKATNLTFRFPNMWLNHVSDKILILAYFVPVDDERAIISLRFYNKITGFRPVDRLIAWLGGKANIVVERQDKRIVETQLPKRSRLRMDESLVAADYPIVAYRSKREELMAAGEPVAVAKEEPMTDDKEKPMADDKEKPMKTNPSMVTSELGLLTATMNPKAMYKLSYGLFVCTARRGDKLNGCIINTAVQVASDPNTISVAINKANYTHDMVMESGSCCLSVISREADFDLFKRFGFQSGSQVDKFADLGQESYRILDSGLPVVVAGTNAYLALKVRQTVDLGSHTLFICEPTAMDVLSEAPSCTYEYYQDSIKPKPQKVGETPAGKTIWRCLICGYEWVGEELPDDFICPICKHPKADFEKVLE